MGAGLKAAGVATKPIQKKALEDIAGQRQPSADRYSLRSLARLGLIVRTKRALPWVLTPDGVEVCFKLGIKVKR